MSESSVTITRRQAGVPGSQQEPEDDAPRAAQANGALRMFLVMVTIALAFAAVGTQLLRLALPDRSIVTASLSEVVGQSFARPDIVDRNGRLLATDVVAYSLYADPAYVLDRDETVEKLGTVFPDLDRAGLRRDLADRTRRFVWVRRGLAPKTAQAVHDLGLPGLDFRRELRRVNPAGTLAGHVLGYVNIDNKGVSGIERYVDEVVGVEAGVGAALAERAPVRLSLDIGVQHAVESELADAARRYEAKGAAGLVLDVETGEVLASASLPEVDPARRAMSLDPARIDKVAGSTFELGSVMKAMTVAMALDAGLARPDTVLDVRKPLVSGRFTFRDPHPVGRPLSVAEVFVHSSNVGAAMLALQAGHERLHAFLERMQLLAPLRTEAGPVAAPQVPARWGDPETITVAFGHGIAVAPLQFAAAAAALVNGGRRIAPTFIKRSAEAGQARVGVISPETSDTMRELMRRNVSDPGGTGRRAEVPGYSVGGKTGTAEVPGPGGYRKDAVISTFLAAFPMTQPKYLVLVLLFEPKPTAEASGEVLAGVNAAPTAGRIIARIGPLLGMLSNAAAAVEAPRFDATRAAKYEAR